MTVRTYDHPMQRAVADFHHAFGMPDLIDTPQALPADRVELRLGLIREEGIVELGQAIADVRNGTTDSPVEIIDAYIDTIYVALGALVEMGHDVQRLPRSPRYPRYPRPLAESAATEAKFIAEPFERLADDAIAYEGTSVQLFSYIARAAYSTLVYSGINPRPFFDEIQRANMSKLGADGTPIHSRGLELDGYPEGKVLKGPNYSPPDLHSVFERVGIRRRTS